jgi:hypothetical protein
MPCAEFGSKQRVGSIFPGTDGSLYAYLAADGSSPRIEASLRQPCQPSAGWLWPRCCLQPNASFWSIDLIFCCFACCITVHVQRLPVGVSDLVNQSPVATLDGSMLIGSQHTSVFLLDGATGNLIRTVYDFDGELGQLDATALGGCLRACLPACWSGRLACRIADTFTCMGACLQWRLAPI